MDDEKLKILLFSWNTQSINLYDSETVDEELEDFWGRISSLITEHQPAIVAIGFQEDIKPGSYLHTSFFPLSFSYLGYSLFETTELMGIGKTCFDGLKRASLFIRGLRLSVYIREDMVARFAKLFKAEEYYESFFQNKGATAIYLTIKGSGETIAFINTHFPFDSNSLSISLKEKDKVIRQDAINAQNSFYNGCYRKLILNKESAPSHAFVMGDLNYRMNAFVDWSASKTGRKILESPESCLQHDELFQQMEKGNVYKMDEGPEGKGPRFLPTCKLNKNRDPAETSINSYNVGRDDSRVPSYCDRILYTPSGIECLIYDKLDCRLISHSDHAAVYGLYSVSKSRP